jgi:hypothetical protein
MKLSIKLTSFISALHQRFQSRFQIIDLFRKKRPARFSEAAVCCRNLEQLYHDAGHPDEASRYSDLAGKYEERTSAKSHKESDATAAMPFAPAIRARSASSSTP